MDKLEAQSSGKLPSQTEINPRENVSAISLRSGKEIEVPSRNHLEEQKDKLNHEKAEEKKKSTEQEVRSEPNSNILTNRSSLPFSLQKEQIHERGGGKRVV